MIQHTRIRPAQRWEAIDFKEVWDYRELVAFLAWRDVKVRYKRAALGIAWAVLQPLMTMIIFTIIFGRVAGLPSEGIPYPLFTLAALVPWQLFANAVSGASNSLIGSAQLLSKVYFPRLIVPLSSVAATLVDFAVALALVAALMLWYRQPINPAIVALPLFVGLAVLIAFGIGLWTSSLNVRYRDVQYVVPFFMQVLLLASPVAYSTQAVPEGVMRTAFALNPLVGVVEGFRWALLGTNPPGSTLWISLAAGLVLIVSGLLVFRRMEATFADVV